MQAESVGGGSSETSRGCKKDSCSNQVRVTQRSWRVWQ